MAVAQPKSQPQILQAIHPEQDPIWQANRARALNCASQALAGQGSQGDGMIAGLLGALGLVALWRAF